MPLPAAPPPRTSRSRTQTRPRAGTAQSGKERAKRLLIAALTVMVLCGMGAVAAERALHGDGMLHRLGATLYGRYKQQKLARAAAVLAQKSPPERATNPLVVYRHGLTPGWIDWSWATHDLKKTGPDNVGIVLSLLPADLKGVYLHRDLAVPLEGYGALGLAVRGDARLKVCLVGMGGQFGPAVDLQKYLSSFGAEIRGTGETLAPGWKWIEIPFAKLEAVAGGSVGTSITGIVVQAAGAEAQPEVLLDKIALQPDQALPLASPTAIVAVTVDSRADRHPISPLIYGMAFAPEDYQTDLRLGLNRWGGNDKSRYNWVQGNACNAARDWRWANKPASVAPLTAGVSSAADDFVRQNQRGGAETLLTVPSLGWVARNADNNCNSQNVPSQGGEPVPGSEADGGLIAGYDAGQNRTRTSVRSGPRKGRPFEIAPPGDSGVVYQDEWVNHLKRTFGGANRAGGVRFYAIDNEPDLWASTHTDVHPARPGYDELLARFVSYASAVKDVDPNAQITGPVSWGWTGYLYSPLDQGSDNYRTHADKTRHGSIDFIPWFLGRMARYDQQQGHRSLDVLDVHFYPQANLYNQSVEPGAQALRLRATRALWDADYTDESWIAEPVRLLPRLREWIAAGYPGTKIGITEWNFGADQHINGALAIAEVLGVFGRENIYLANYWAYPLKSSPGYLAFKLLRHPDPVTDNRFGDTSVRAVSQDDYKLSSFAATDTKRQMLTVLLINKMPHTEITVPVSLSGVQAGAPAHTYLLSARDSTGVSAKITKEKAGAALGAGSSRATLQVKLPPSAALLLCLPLKNVSQPEGKP